MIEKYDLAINRTGCEDEGIISILSGEFLNVFNPDPDTMNLLDIVSALAKLCRFGGQCERFYSVAEHSVIVAQEVKLRGGNWDTQVAALWHDAGEAYIGDMCRPIKNHPSMQAFREVENLLMDAILRKLPVDEKEIDWEIIKECDNTVCRAEAALLMKGSGAWKWEGCQMATSFVHTSPTQVLTPPLAEASFLDFWGKLLVA